MHRIFVGYSSSLDSREMKSYFDVDFFSENRISKFEYDFGCEYIEPGSFEVYGRYDYANTDFDIELISKLLPFDIDNQELCGIDFDNAKSVFFVSTPEVSRMYNSDIIIVSDFFIQKFNFE